MPKSTYPNISNGALEDLAAFDRAGINEERPLLATSVGTAFRAVGLRREPARVLFERCLSEPGLRRRFILGPSYVLLHL